MTLLDPIPTQPTEAPTSDSTADRGDKAAPDAPTTYSIAEVSERMNLNPHTLRYYERVGLLSVERDIGGRRVYNDLNLMRIKFITCLRATDMPIRQIQRYCELADIGAGTEAERLRVLQEHRENVVAQLADVQQALAAIEFKIELYGGSGGGCTTRPPG